MKQSGTSCFLLLNWKGEFMYTTISTKNMSHEEWLDLRKTGIGGSDAGAVCGLNPYVSSIGVYLNKIGKAPEVEDNEAMRQGRDMEDYVARRFSEKTGLKVRRSHQLYRSKEHPFMIADVDRMIVGEDAGLECKTVSAYGADKWKDGQIPVHYLLQCLHYMAVTGKKTWYIAAVILGVDFQYRKIEWEEEMISKLIEVEQRFWEQFVCSGHMPDPDGTEACSESLTKYFNKAKKGTAIPLIGFDERLNRRELILQQIESLETEKRQIEQEVRCYLQENETAFNENYRVSWFNVETNRLDTKQMKEEHPDLYQKFLKKTVSRRLQIKACLLYTSDAADD